MAIMIPKQQYLHALFFSALFLLANKVHSQDVTSFTFDTFSANSTDLTYQGGTHVPPGSDFLRLTKTDSSGVPESWTVGRVLYSRPVQLWESSTAREATFETTIRFVIKSGERGVADGLAFFIAPVGTTIPSGSGGINLGIFGLSGTADALFAVEFDSLANSWGPRYHHIGIDVNSRESRAAAAFVGESGEVVTARINYNANTRTVTVAVSSGSQSTTTLSYVVDLKTVVPERVQVGISSATGTDPRDLGIHDIHSWYFTSSLVQDSAQTYIRQAV